MIEKLIKEQIIYLDNYNCFINYILCSQYSYLKGNYTLYYFNIDNNEKELETMGELNINQDKKNELFLHNLFENTNYILETELYNNDNICVGNSSIFITTTSSNIIDLNYLGDPYEKRDNKINFSINLGYSPEDISIKLEEIKKNETILNINLSPKPKNALLELEIKRIPYGVYKLYVIDKIGETIIDNKIEYDLGVIINKTEMSCDLKCKEILPRTVDLISYEYNINRLVLKIVNIGDIDLQYKLMDQDTIIYKNNIVLKNNTDITTLNINNINTIDNVYIILEYLDKKKKYDLNKLVNNDNGIHKWWETNLFTDKIINYHYEPLLSYSKEVLELTKTSTLTYYKITTIGNTNVSVFPRNIKKTIEFENIETELEIINKTDDSILNIVNIPNINKHNQYLFERIKHYFNREIENIYLYYAPKDRGSFGWHYDTVDVYIYCLKGTRKFQVSGTESHKDLIIDTILTQGDSIYIPAGYYHKGYSTNETSITVNVGFNISSRKCLNYTNIL